MDLCYTLILYVFCTNLEIFLISIHFDKCWCTKKVMWMEWKLVNVINWEIECFIQEIKLHVIIIING